MDVVVIRPNLSLCIIANALVDGAHFTCMCNRLYVQLRGYNSPGFDTKSVVYRYSQTLLAANRPFCVVEEWETCPRRNWIYSSSPPRIMAETHPTRG